MNLSLQAQLAFLLEIDKLKSVLRRTQITDGSRYENSAEHSWHLALMALVLSEYSDVPVNRDKVMQLVLVHDLVEIDAGDAPAYDLAANLGKEERERLAAERIFGLLPPDQSAFIMALWREFEEGATPEARFANALDRFQPLLQNTENNGGSWLIYRVTRAQVEARMAPIALASARLWNEAVRLMDAAQAMGYIQPNE